MSGNIFELKHIFGLKLRDLRQEKQLTYQELSAKSNLSVSYLSEIESGKKYPKGDKILQLASALETSYDELVSLKVSDKFQPVIELLDSWILKDFPLEKFGLSPQKLIDIISQDPIRTGAFIKSILQLALKYEIKAEQFYSECLSSFIELQKNYFPEIEEIVESLRLEFANVKLVPFKPSSAENILLNLGVRIDDKEIPKHPKLIHLRSLYDSKKRILYVNSDLTDGQKNFLIGREIGFQWMKLKIRPMATPWPDSKNFEELLNSYKASYFSAALVMPRKSIIGDLKDLFQSKIWEPKKIMKMLSHYKSSPEMLMQRISTILPSAFGLDSLFFLRFLNSNDSITLTKELHLSNQHNPHANEINEHYCRRMLGIRLFEFARKSDTNPVVDAQKSIFTGSNKEYFSFSIAFPNVSNPNEFMSVTLGVLIDKNLTKTVNFLDDPNLPTYEIGGTCERCSIQDCSLRMIPSIILDRQNDEHDFHVEIEKILE